MTGARAGAISRILRSAGFPLAKDSGFHEGFYSEQRTHVVTRPMKYGFEGKYADREPTGVVLVYYDLSQYGNVATKHARRKDAITRASELLRERGYDVKVKDIDGVSPHIAVCRLTEEGLIVK